MKNSGKKIRALRDKKKYPNSCVVKKLCATPIDRIFVA
jgi:hypothetical protein